MHGLSHHSAPLPIRPISAPNGNVVTIQISITFEERLEEPSRALAFSKAGVSDFHLWWYFLDVPSFSLCLLRPPDRTTRPRSPQPSFWPI